MGFLADRAPYTPPAQRGSASTSSTIAYRNEFRETLWPQGFASGVALLRDCVRSQRSIGGDLALLLREAHEARDGFQGNHACGRMAGFMYEFDRVLYAIRDAGVSLDLPAFNEYEFSEQLKTGVAPCLEK